MGLSQLDGIGHLLHQLPGQDLQGLKDGAAPHLKQTEMFFDADENHNDSPYCFF